jgi:hypothetical protein
MLVGSPDATVPVDNDPAFIGYTCQNGAGSQLCPQLHQTTIPFAAAGGFLRAELRFFDCWDGVNLDSTTHNSHVAFQVNGACPSTHPVPVPQIGLEYGWDSSMYDGSQLLLSTGDRAGYGKSELITLILFLK